MSPSTADRAPGQLRLLFLVDRPGTPAETRAREVAARLRGPYRVEIAHSERRPLLCAPNIDLLCAFSWRETYHLRLPLDPRAVVKLVTPSDWPDEPSVEELVFYNLLDAGHVLTPSEAVSREISKYHPQCVFVPEGLTGPVLDRIAAGARGTLWRNDDVSADTDLASFRRFCGIFGAHGLTQVHGVTLRGKLARTEYFLRDPVKQGKEPTPCLIPNDRIRALAEGTRMEDRPDLVEFLATSPDEVALHGLYHTDYSAMPADQQEEEIARGLQGLRELWPGRTVHRFIPPFNRFNLDTWRICRKLGLELMLPFGVHLEAAIHQGSTPLRHGAYRYHHHRFYPASDNGYYRVSLESLDAYLTRVVEASENPADGAMVEAAPRPRPSIRSLAGRGWRFGRRLAGRAVRWPRKAAAQALDRLGSWALGRPAPLSVGLLRKIVQRHGAEPWFVYAHEAVHTHRWDIRVTREWIAANRPRSDRILELGCGAGLNLHWLARQGFRDLEGWDRSATALAAAREVAERTRYPARFRQCDILTFPEPDRLYDVMLSLIVTYLNPSFDLASFLRFYGRFLTPTGVLLVDCIDRQYDLYPGNQYHTADADKPEYLRRPNEYLQRYTEEEVAEYARQAGLEVADVITRPLSVPKWVYVFRPCPVQNNPGKMIPGAHVSQEALK